MIAHNPDALLELLGFGEGDPEDDGEEPGPGTHVLEVTEEERAAIARVR